MRIFVFCLWLLSGSISYAQLQFGGGGSLNNRATNWVNSGVSLSIESTERLRFKDWNFLTNTDGSGNILQFRSVVRFVRTNESRIIYWTGTNTCSSTNGTAFGGTNQWAFGLDAGLATNRVMYADDGSGPLGSGQMLSCEVNTLNLISRRGECYIQAEVSKWPNTDFPENGFQLFCGYFTGNHHLSWPMATYDDQVSGHPLIRHVTFTAPGAGNEITNIVPTNVRWKLKGMRFTFTTGTNVANRIVRILIDDGTNIIYDRFCKTTQTASQAMAYQIWPFGYDTSATPETGSAANQLFIGLPIDGIELFQGWRIRTAAVNLQALDAYTSESMLVEQLIEE